MNKINPFNTDSSEFAGFLCPALFLTFLLGITFNSPGQEIKVSDVSAIERKTGLETEPGQYLIGPGDVLDIRIYNRPQLSREAVRVDERGMLRMPLIETEIRAACRTESQLAREIADLYLEFLRNPHVEVFIKDFQSKPVAVIGAVREPGRFLMQRQVRLLELIAFAGGPTDLAGGRIQIKHDSGNRPCTDQSVEKIPDEISPQNFSAEDQTKNVRWFQLKDLLQDNVAEENNPFMVPGDIVNLVEADKVYVVGNVYKPTIIPLKEQITLTQAIAMAGGLLPATNFDRVRLIRKTGEANGQTETIVDLKAIKKQKEKDIILQANDIVEVPTSPNKKFFQGLINSVAPAVSRLPVRVIP